jgi:tetratricopeptide (TPR) repeat protein
VIAAGGLLAYHNSFGVPFVLDDRLAIGANPSLRSLWTAWWPPDELTGLPISGRPVVNFTLGLNYAISGTGVWSYHVVNLLIHVVCGMILFGVVRRTLLQPALAPRFGRHAFELALATAVLWTVHPLQTESVTYISQRAESLVGLLYFLTLWCFIRAIEPGASRNWSLGAVVACLLGTATKEVIISAPLIAALYDRAFVAGSWREVWMRHRKLLLALAGTWLVLAWFVARSGGARGASAGFGLGVSPWNYLLQQCEAIVLYLKLSFWPHSLVLDYGTGVVHSLADVWWQAIIVLALFGATIWALLRKPKGGILGAWFFLILAPSSSVVPLVGQTMAEHRMYLPLAAVITGGVAALYLLLQRLQDDKTKGLPGLPVRGPTVSWSRGLVVLLLAAALGLGFMTGARNRDYRDTVTIWTGAATNYPSSARAHNNLAVALHQRGKNAEANDHFARAVALQPDYVAAHYDWGVALLDQGRVNDAIVEFSSAVRLAPEHANAQVNLGNALVRAQRAAEAVPHYRAALQTLPSADAHYDLGVALVAIGRTDEAAGEFRAALQLGLDRAETHYQLARLADSAGQYADAERHYGETLRIAPEHAAAHSRLGLLMARSGRLPPAAEHFRAVLRLQPGDADAHANLGNVLLLQGQAQEAVAQYEEALRLRPDDERMRESLRVARESSRP